MEKEWFEYDREKQQITVRLADKKEIRITPADVSVSYFSGGPGGQHLNKTMNGVRLIYHIPYDYLNTYQKTRQLVSRSIGQRSREQNMKLAFDQMADKIRRYFYIPQKRKKTRVPKGSREKRLQGKKMRGRLKQDRKNIDY
ncbi:MAG: peptide chain release factor-like protein [Patescibacteria group bacterium]